MIWPFTRPPHSAAVSDYLARTRKRIPPRTPLDSLRIVVLDTETSGFHLEKDRILSVACMDIVKGQIEIGSIESWIVRQPRTAPNKASEVHGLLPSEIRQGREENDVLLAVIERLAGAVVVGHNIWFDALMLDEAMHRLMGIHFLNPTIDCGKMAMNELIPFHKVGYSRQKIPSIEDICGHLDLPMPDRHTAEGDAFIAAELFLLLAGRTQRRLGHPLRLADLPHTRRINSSGR